jgi:hypothetical protein
VYLRDARSRFNIRALASKTGFSSLMEPVPRSRLVFGLLSQMPQQTSRCRRRRRQPRRLGSRSVEEGDRAASMRGGVRPDVQRSGPNGMLTSSMVREWLAL